MFFNCLSFFTEGNSDSNIEHAAPWLPDNLSNQCMHCKKTQFTVINRRVSDSFKFGFFFLLLFCMIFCMTFIKHSYDDELNTRHVIMIKMLMF